MIDWTIVELQSQIMQYENEIIEAIQDKDWEKAERLISEYNKFRKANKNLL